MFGLDAAPVPGTTRAQESHPRSPHAPPCAAGRARAAVTAHRPCAGWMRRQFPERRALKNRLHYLLTRQRGLALWQAEDGKLLAGFATWQGQKKAVSAARLGELSD